ncbi:related to Aminodeoxychorismate synthase [Saccharomycodes ludwigii]|uniref:aminodeoxychorismate synthase n=1 Tax=Saccharomycodes ludwigii TaxID=36035 RepID=A0A376B7P9_9ASCO|nr:related to Aminodeoxychorismate synthase [Saccharomycodes ludwigii]
MTYTLPLNLLYIDSYDSFAYNIIDLIKSTSIIANDAPYDLNLTIIQDNDLSVLSDLITFSKKLSQFHGIIIGPGPGNPRNFNHENSIIYNIFNRFKDTLAKTPILGICLGFQSMSYLYAHCSICELDNIKHGQIYEMELLNNNINNDDKNIFENYPRTFKSVRYHSLHITNITADLIPLVVTKEKNIATNDTIIMGGKIRDRCWFGVQYHPESCCSEYGQLLFDNFIGKFVLPNYSNVKLDDHNMEFTETHREFDTNLTINTPKNIEIDYRVIDIPKNITNIPQFLINLGEFINAFDSNFVLLASSKLQPNCGQYSIFGLSIQNKTTVFQYIVATGEFFRYLYTHDNSTAVIDSSIITKDEYWSKIEKFMEDKTVDLSAMEEYNNAAKDLNELPFIGGIMGGIGYELGWCVPMESNIEKDKTIDSLLVYIENTIVIDHINNKMYFISINGKTDDIPLFGLIMNSIMRNEIDDTHVNNNVCTAKVKTVVKPDKQKYIAMFNKCQEYLNKGDSYELCLTNQCEIHLENTDPTKIGWMLFKKLLLLNPAPFSSYINFPQYKLVSSSPERFLKWDEKLTCELRPIKGTVSKKKVNDDIKEATKILNTPKEFGENLMIVDLIRNDLYENLPLVKLEKLMGIEEFETVYQLVSVIKGYASNSSGDRPVTIPTSGFQILKKSLPPGSMTGAPKKSSVEILYKDIEGDMYKNRKIYSGVTGYYGINRRGDWSVNIRCMYSLADPLVWRLGCGGAITVLSNAEDEYEEMLTKLNSTLQIF